MDEKKKRSYSIYCSLDEETSDMLFALTKILGTTKSKAVREAIRNTYRIVSLAGKTQVAKSLDE